MQDKEFAELQENINSALEGELKSPAKERRGLLRDLGAEIDSLVKAIANCRDRLRHVNIRISGATKEPDPTGGKDSLNPVPSGIIDELHQKLSLAEKAISLLQEEIVRIEKL